MLFFETPYDLLYSLNGMLLILDVVRALTALGNILFFLYLIRFLSRSVDNIFLLIKSNI